MLNIYRAQKMWPYHVERPFSFPNQIRISRWVKLHIWWWNFLLLYSKDLENKWKYISILTLCLIWSWISIVGSRWSPSEIKILWWKCHFYTKGTLFQMMSLDVTEMHGISFVKLFPLSHFVCFLPVCLLPWFRYAIFLRLYSGNFDSPIHIPHIPHAAGSQSVSFSLQCYRFAIFGLHRGAKWEKLQMFLS